MPDTGPGYRRETAQRGDTFARQYVCQNSAGTPINLTGFTAIWIAVSGDIEIRKETPTDLVISTPTNGTIDLTLSPDDTLLIPRGSSMKYKLKIISSTGVETTIIYGDLVGEGDIESG